ncbi:squalene synthase HpnC [Rhodoferax sp.]|uniref:squalene synthase HpnC n=1 Tax=Rhodoferax sp. TaxID=50421 RepID=UPI002719C78B|nr:squalene synthase HpnC [Rhodoferax sp.]MDO9196467.1 squalene synthase HpnC [Rhodoferax sp.]
MQRPTSLPTPPPTAPAVEHYENFPVASFLCPAHLRAPIAAIYHFARTADDIADEGEASPAQRLLELQAYRQDLIAASENKTAFSPRWAPVFGPLQAAISAHQLPVPALHDLLDAFEQDVAKSRDRAGYANEVELLDYCRRSANPVGRLLLHLYGVSDPHALRQSDDICTALQLINFWQDLSVDIPRGRYYLTQEDCARFDVVPADILACRQTPSATRLIANCVDSARARMQKGAALVHQVPGRAGWELRLVVQGGMRILDKIQDLHYATLSTRPTLKWWDAPVMLWRALWM